MSPVRAIVLTGFGLNCDYETDYSLRLAGAESRRVHINELIKGTGSRSAESLDHYHILVFGGGFSWADDHGAGVIFASKIKFNIGKEVERFIQQGKLVIGICNGFQALVNMGLLPGFEGNHTDRRVALVPNDSGNFIDTWVNLRVNPKSPCIFTRGVSCIELPVRHGEGKFYAPAKDLERLFDSNQVVLQYADENGNEAGGKWPANPNGSLGDIAGICDSTGRIFGLMPHPEAFHHFTNHPDWVRKREELAHRGKKIEKKEGEGIKIFRNAVEYVREKFNLDPPN
ncbi:MAG: phosphoribosylformylglycinamidine synthase I [Deltaproteobacteria bacterium]|nr:phosphoribosylformylglycinamidine synthase I [Deltaproteobacteria bacterium]MBW1920373.1 phosphoribosylformylglycinamidine synthase I [Deltaproteobacteria bacterium]MBW1932270.1 phosphoribosylformylglycinamidine synthase I [Deltaproteobacteria bacterium]MBW1978121.1 phosphoribosylformylglycinamidine synthase I [Deltaproteobacteria bacterium]MBW2044811.1 phosphoribosylformylglycinamidine synthase I [Deltaproteobacteria bacterium]